MTPDQEKPMPSQPRHVPPPPPGLRDGTELPAVVRLQRIVALLVLICLVVSACLNVYVIFENRTLSGEVSFIRERQKAYGEMHRAVRDITLDLRVLSRTDANAARLLTKHKQFFSKFMLDDMTRGVPQR